VHTNSGVNNKLCYLLTDGGTFNGQTVTGVGTVAVVRLYYEAQTHLLTSSSGWTELFDALRQAARNLGWDSGMQNDLYRACAAVEIATHTTVYADAASGCGESGTQSCVLGLGPFRTLGGAQAAIWPGTVVVAAPGTYHEGLITFDKNATYTANGGTVVITP
jgi:hypothetical protein